MAQQVRSIPNLDTTFVVVRAGSGDRVIGKGNTVVVHAAGTVVGHPRPFWNTRDKNQPFQFKAGVKEVITGWDMGCLGMKVGEVRDLTIPAKEGYGKGGFPAWNIPQNATLNFRIEVLQIK